MNSPKTDTAARERFASLTAAAEAGDAEAQFQLGLAYQSGDGVQAHDTMAALWFKRAAQQDHPEGLREYADCLFYGKGIKEDLAKAFTNYLKGANLGNIRCQYATGYCYGSGTGVEEDQKLAFYWYKRAADVGDGEAQAAMGLCYEDGKGVDVDFALAEQWYRKAAAQNTLWAYHLLGNFFRFVEEVRDPLEADYWYRKGAELGCARSQKLLGQMLLFDEDTPRNYQEAAYWLRKAALGGQPEAHGDLGFALSMSGVADDEEIVYWSTRCLEDQNNFNAPFDMAAAYERAGHHQMAALFFAISVDKGDHEIAPSKLEKLQRLHGATPETGKAYLEQVGVDYEDIACGAYIMPLTPGESPYYWDNLPVPPAVQAEMSLEEETGPPEDTAAMQHAGGQSAAMQPAPSDALVDSTVKTPSVPPAASEPPLFQPSISSLNPSQLPPGSILAEKYLIEKVLGKGGMAIVFKAKHLLMDRPVAIKMMLPEVARDATTVSRFQREAKNASVLRHPNVITIYDYGVSPEGQPFMVMDYLDGDSLEDVLERDGKLGVERAIKLLVQICDALGAAHQMGIIHRDIKPSNVMIENTHTHKDFVRLVDFGIAKAIDDQNPEKQKLTKTGEVFGSLVYMSPEQCMGRPVDARSDIYSFGCVLFEVFIGETPFMGETVFETMSKHIYEAPPAMAPQLPSVPQSGRLQQIFEKCVAKTPEERYQSMSEVREDLLSIRP